MYLEILFIVLVLAVVAVVFVNKSKGDKWRTPCITLLCIMAIVLLIMMTIGFCDNNDSGIIVPRQKIATAKDIADLFQEP